MSAVFLDSFSGAIGDMKPRDQRDSRKVLAVLRDYPRFSVFDATERDAIARTLTNLYGAGLIDYPKPQPGYPWCRAVVTPKGLQLLEPKVDQEARTTAQETRT